MQSQKRLWAHNMDNEHPDSITDHEGLICEKILLSDSNEEILTDIDPIMIYNHLTSERRSNSKNALPFTAELFLHCFLRYINGGSSVDIRLVTQSCKASFLDVSMYVYKLFATATVLIWPSILT